jgi:transposase-like protein
MESVNCPACKGNELQRYGKTKAGLQKYRCLAPRCRRQFVAGSTHLIDPEKKKIVQDLLGQGIPPKKIKAAVPEISVRWLYELRRKVR